MGAAGTSEEAGSRTHRWTAGAIRAQGASPLGRGLAIVAILLALSWLISYLLGGAGRVPPHWFYVPILVAAARFGLAGAAATAVVAGVIAGPLLPLDVTASEPQELSDWAGRLGFFLGIGLVMGTIIVRLSTSLERELTLAKDERDIAVGQGEQRTRAILESAHEAVIGMDASGLIIDWNRAAEITFGWSRGEAIGRVLADTVIPERYRDAHRKGLERFLTTGEGPVLNTRMELEALHRNGREFPVELTISALLEEGGGEVSFIAFVHDITERKQAENALRSAKADAERAREEAEHANLAKSEFLSRMSHELRTPLTAILGFAQLLEMGELQPEQRERAEHIITGGRRLLELINEVLDIARIESGRLALSLAPVSICDLIDECVGLIRPLAEERRLRLHSECADQGQHVLADRQRLGQVLLNLLSNAVKYNVDEGSVTVTCSPPAGKLLRIGVTDTGPGIPPEKVPSLFTPFERLEAEASSVEGSGLGLAVSKSLVEAMGGRLLVDTTVGRGTTFWVEMSTAEQIEIEPLEPTSDTRRERD